MQRVLSSCFLGMASLALAGIASADPSNTLADVAQASEQAVVWGSAADEQCSTEALERYARRRAFTWRLMEQRAEERFNAELEGYERRLAFTEQLIQQRAQLSPAERNEFDAAVERYARLYAFTQQLQQERDDREAAEYVREFAIEEKKRAFTQKLLESRAHSASSPNNP